METELSRIDDMQERELIQRFQGGESWAFDRLMEKHQERVYRIAFGMLGDHDSAADIVQEVFIRAFRSLKKFRRDSSLSTWLHRITVNLSIGEIRKRKVRNHLSLTSFTERLRSPIGRPSKELDRKDDQERIQKAVEKLPPRQRAIFVMRHDEDLSHVEIAAALELSEGAVRASYFQALKKLREELGDHEPA
jgi:RNA polymerase sigma-70 factor, ECF subfamily